MLSWEEPNVILGKAEAETQGAGTRAEQKEKEKRRLVINNTQNTWFFSRSSGKCGEAEVEKR